MEAFFNSGVGLALFGIGIGTGLTVFGAALGIGKIAAATVESSARQPEVAGKLQTQMIIGAALIEGFTFAAVGAIFFAIVQVGAFIDKSPAPAPAAHAAAPSSEAPAAGR